MILFDSDSDNNIVYQDISLLFCNVITLVAGAAMIRRQITTRILFYVMICHLYGICCYEKISCYFISFTVMFRKCKKYFTSMNMVLNARLTFLPTDFDQISQ